MFKNLQINGSIDFQLIELKLGEEFNQDGIFIITVINGKAESVKSGGILNKFESSVYYQPKIRSLENTLISLIKIKDENIVLNKVNVEKEFGEFCRNSWTSGNKLFPGCGLENTDLYRSNQVEYEFQGVKYKFNYWFCGANVNCGIHNQHGFIETHTNIAGDGFMQKFESKDEKSIIETVGLMPGSSHKRFDFEGQKDDKGNPKYPFHRWLGGNTGNIWLVIEQY